MTDIWAALLQILEREIGLGLLIYILPLLLLFMELYCSKTTENLACYSIGKQICSLFSVSVFFYFYFHENFYYSKTLPDAIPQTGKIHPCSKIAVTFEPIMQFDCL